MPSKKKLDKKIITVWAHLHKILENADKSIIEIWSVVAWEWWWGGAGGRDYKGHLETFEVMDVVTTLIVELSHDYVHMSQCIKFYTLYVSDYISYTSLKLL